MVFCANCVQNSLLFILPNLNLLSLLAIKIKKNKNLIFSLIIIIFISSLMFYLPDLFVLSYVGLSGTVGFFAPTFVLRTGDGNRASTPNALRGPAPVFD